jgi:hypothetical protein
MESRRTDLQSKKMGMSAGTALRKAIAMFSMLPAPATTSLSQTLSLTM